MAKKIFSVSGMKCEHCTASVEDSVKSVDGVVSAVANLEKKSLTVEYDESKVSDQQIKDAVEEAGRFFVEE